MRVESRVALVVIIDNIFGRTDVRSISTGSSQRAFLKFDWGAAEKLIIQYSQQTQPLI